MSSSLAARAAEIRAQLCNLDRRFAGVRSPLFAEEVRRGAAGDLLARAESSAPEVDRVAALEALALVFQHRGTDESMLARLARVARDGEPAVRGAAARAMACSGHPGIVAAFERQLVADNPRLAAAAALAMGAARRQEAVPVVATLLEQSPAAELRRACARALGEIGGERAHQALSDALAGGRAPTAVLDAIASVGDRRDVPYLLTSLAAHASDVRMAAARALAAIAERTELDAIEPALQRALTAESEPAVGVVLISCLVRLGARVPRQQLERILEVDLGGRSLREALRSSVRGGRIRTSARTSTHAATAQR